MRQIMLLGILLVVAHASAASTSVYTTIDNTRCQKDNLGGNNQGSSWDCPGVAGYVVNTTYGDTTAEITLHNRDSTRGQRLLLPQIIGPIDSLGSLVEWRLNQNIPVALIVRYIKKDQIHPLRTLQPLAVAKLTPTPCLVGIVKAGPRQNALARVVADRASRLPCMTPPN